MRSPFVRLFFELDSESGTTAKVEAIARYFSTCPPQDRIWALAIFTGKAGKRPINSRQMRETVLEQTGMSAWLLEESYQVVGDLAETLSHLCHGKASNSAIPQLSDWMSTLLEFQGLEEPEKKAKLAGIWAELTQEEVLVFNKLVTGGFRVGVSQNLLIRGIAQAFSLDPVSISHRIMGNWQPEFTDFQTLISGDGEEDVSRPYPFFLAHPWEESNESSAPSEWQAEYKWDGIRCQLISRKGQVFLWSRGEDILTHRFPELEALGKALPDGTVLDGELLAWRDERILPFQLLQTRITRKNPTKKQLTEAPAVIFGYDVLEWDGKDIRSQPLHKRREILENLVSQTQHPALHLSPAFVVESWETLRNLRSQASQHSAEGLMLKHRDSPYRSGRKRGDWWKWKLDPLHIDGVLVYAQKGHGRRADLFTDYTLAVWHEGRLLPFAKAYSGLSDEEIRKVDAFIKRNTLEKFGPVRTVKPELVFEIHFEGIQQSPRHKSGVALRFPRIGRWRTDKKPEEANSLSDLQALLK